MSTDKSICNQFLNIFSFTYKKNHFKQVYVTVHQEKIHVGKVANRKKKLRKLFIKRDLRQTLSKSSELNLPADSEVCFDTDQITNLPTRKGNETNQTESSQPQFRSQKETKPKLRYRISTPIKNFFALFEQVKLGISFPNDSLI